MLWSMTLFLIGSLGQNEKKFSFYSLLPIVKSVAKNKEAVRISCGSGRHQFSHSDSSQALSHWRAGEIGHFSPSL